MTVYLVCEGGPTGLDNRVLNAVVVQAQNLPVQIAPAGGSGGLGAVREYLLKRTPGDTAICVEDRDYYQARATADAGWSNRTGNRYTWRRHEIENYLLVPAVVLKLFDRYRQDKLSWAAALPATEPDVLEMLGQVASRSVENHTGEALAVELLRATVSGGNLQFGAPKPKSAPGAAFPGAAEWLAALTEEAARLCGVCTAAAGLPGLSATEIEARYSQLLAGFQQQSFLTSGDFLVDMGGHELMKGLALELRRQGAPAKVSQSFLEDELLQALSAIYQPGAFYQPDDFQELADILRQYC